MSKYFDGSGTIGFTCDVCGRQVQGYTWVNGMRFCAKCYQETFGASKDWQLLDKDKTITEQRKQISNLEAKLAESEKQVNHWHNLYNDRDNQFQSVRQRYHLLNKLQSNYDKKDKLHLAYMQCLELVDENEQLKQQLAELQECGLKASSKHNLEMQNAQACVKKLEEELLKQEKEYDEQLLKQAEIHKRHIKELNEQLEEWKDGTIICKWTDAENKVKELEQQLAEKDKEIEELTEELDDKNFCKGFVDLYNENKLLRKGHNQDKISFAVEKLEKVKELCKKKFEWWEDSELDGDIYDKSDVSNAYFDIEAHIEEQIKQLKEGK